MNREILPQDIREAVAEARQRQRTLATILGYLTEVEDAEWTQSHRDTVRRAEMEIELIECATHQVLCDWRSGEASSAKAGRLLRETLKVAQTLCSARARESAILKQLLLATDRYPADS